MNRKKATDFFGGTVEGLAEQLNVTAQAIYRWPDGKLNLSNTRRVLGAALIHALERDDITALEDRSFYVTRVICEASNGKYRCTLTLAENLGE